jgi:hypothetical protein
MTKTLLIDPTRSFLDGRDSISARDGEKAVAALLKNEGSIGIIWLDTLPKIDMLLSFLTLRSKMGSPYPVNIINVHAPQEVDWQLFQATLKRAGYQVRRASIRDTLGN